MYKKLFLSATSLVSVVALGIGTTYALFTSNTVTMSANSITTGVAAIKLCRATTDDAWRNALTTNFTLTGMIPGGVEKELTTGAEIHVGNDSGGLINNLTVPTRCNTYGDTASSSSTNVKLVPKIQNLVCPGTLPTDLQLRFEIGGIDSGFGTMAFWQTNATPYGAQFNPDQDGQVKIFSQLSSGATDQGTACTFDVTFQGLQV